MSKRSDREAFVVHLTDAGEPGSAPVIVRLRKFLKAALRSYQLRCVSAREARPGEGPRADNDQDEI